MSSVCPAEPSYKEALDKRQGAIWATDPTELMFCQGSDHSKQNTEHWQTHTDVIKYTEYIIIYRPVPRINTLLFS